MNPMEMAKILNYLIERAESADREAAKQESSQHVIRCEQNCPACDIGNHHRCRDKRACECTHPGWEDIQEEIDVSRFRKFDSIH